ncbi:MAG: hypothetical protein LBG95_08465 [Treponema sp.]|jgi:hypothetical protein|nr:hypothetical protein [Treponema sp.]
MKASHKKALFFCVVFAAVAIMGHAQIDRGELQNNLAPVSFTNYEGPHARIETREQIRQIGTSLGQAIRDGAARTGAANRYFVIHSVSAPDGSKLDADIFGLGADSGVDHVRNLRVIIQGYLQDAYGYSAPDAALLAEYITIYNAVYRGNWNYFTGRYKGPVIANLNREHAGLATRYDEWPGKTLMVIPLGIGDLSSVDTSAISDNRVVEEMRRDDDKGLEQRRDMVNLKEREAGQAEQKAETQREAIRQEEQEIAEERSRLERERQQTAADRQKLEEEKAAGTVTRQEAAQQERDLQKQETETEKKSGELDKREESVAQQKEEAARQELFAERKTEEAQRDRESVARDQQLIINRGDQPIGVIGLVIEKPDAVMGRLVSIDPSTRKELRRSALDSVHVRTLTFTGGRILAIAGENMGNGAVRLIEINSRSLEMDKQGDDDLQPNSLLWVNGNDLYAITINLDNGNLYLGRFNANLELQAKSEINVHSNAAVSIQQGGLLTQKADGSAAVLDPASLKEK